MRVVTYQAEQGPRAGALWNGRIVDLGAASGGDLPCDVPALLAADGALERAARLLAGIDAKQGAGLPRGAVLPLRSAVLRAPVPRPGKVSCLGLNYSEHAAEGGAQAPSEPIVFAKAATSVIGPGEAIVLPAASRKVDYEVELAVVIGRKARQVSAADAMQCVAGYMVLNDVSARDYQHEKPGRQWYLGKSFDTFCPTGPWLVTRDEIPDPHRLALQCEVSGEVMQSSSTAAMVFRVPEIIAYISRVFTLEPGDVIGTGTPPGVGEARTPPRFLRPGDVVRCTIEGIGVLENPVRQAAAP